MALQHAGLKLRPNLVARLIEALRQTWCAITAPAADERVRFPADAWEAWHERGIL